MYAQILHNFAWNQKNIQSKLRLPVTQKCILFFENTVYWTENTVYSRIDNQETKRKRKKLICFEVYICDTKYTKSFSDMVCQYFYDIKIVFLWRSPLELSNHVPLNSIKPYFYVCWEFICSASFKSLILHKQGQQIML